jgi:intracellular sulfur oxidation DsrE/DsrF family protein
MWAFLGVVAVATSACGGTEDLPPIAAKGPVIEDYGAVYDVEGAVRIADPSEGLRAVFDVAEAPDDVDELNERIDTVARYLNLHARNGFDRANTRAAVVLHGSAARSALGDAAHRARFGSPNPDLELLRSLREAGVRIYVCGQTAARNGFERDELDSSVELALSAMTVLIQLHDEGYVLIRF